MNDSYYNTKSKISRFYKIELNTLIKSHKFFLPLIILTLLSLLSINNLLGNEKEIMSTNELFFLDIFTAPVVFATPLSFILSFIIPLFSLLIGFDSYADLKINKNGLQIRNENLFVANILATITFFSIIFFLVFAFIAITASIVFTSIIMKHQFIRFFLFYLLTICYATAWYIAALYLSLKAKNKIISALIYILVFLFLLLLWNPLMYLISAMITNTKLGEENLFFFLSTLSIFTIYNATSFGLLIIDSNIIRHPLNFKLLPLTNFKPQNPLEPTMPLLLGNILLLFCMIIFLTTLGYILIQRKTDNSDFQLFTT